MRVLRSGAFWTAVRLLLAAGVLFGGAAGCSDEPARTAVSDEPVVVTRPPGDGPVVDVSDVVRDPVGAAETVADAGSGYYERVDVSEDELNP